MKCDRCGEGKEKGQPYEFYYGKSTKSQRVRSDHALEKKYQSHVFFDGKIEGWICSDCLIRMIVNDPMGVMLIAANIIMWIAGIIMGGFFEFVLGGLVMTIAFPIVFGYITLDRFFLKNVVDLQGIRLHQREMEKKLREDNPGLIPGFWTRSQYKDIQKQDTLF